MEGQAYRSTKEIILKELREMRKLMLSSLFLLVLHTTYYDLTTGTLTNNRAISEVSEAVEVGSPEKNSPYVVYKINAGDTVLSLVEKANGSIPVPIETVVHDFETLNKIHPTLIQIGKEYRIPTYDQTSAQ